MSSRELGNRGSQERCTARLDLAFRALLVAALWTLLRFLGGDLNSVVSVAILAAIFGHEALRSGREWLSVNASAREHR